MPITTLTDAKENGTYLVTASFTDEAGENVVPQSIIWTLKDSTGAVVNSREDISVTPAETITILLSGADLYVGTRKYMRLTLTLTMTYNSSYGMGLTSTEQVWIHVEAIE